MGDDGFLYLPSTQRADGTWRKPTKIKPGNNSEKNRPKFYLFFSGFEPSTVGGLTVGASLAASQDDSFDEPTV